MNLYLSACHRLENNENQKFHHNYDFSIIINTIDKEFKLKLVLDNISFNYGCNSLHKSSQSEI